MYNRREYGGRNFKKRAYITTSPAPSIVNFDIAKRPILSSMGLFTSTLSPCVIRKVSITSQIRDKRYYRTASVKNKKPPVPPTPYAQYTPKRVCPDTFGAYAQWCPRGTSFKRCLMDSSSSATLKSPISSSSSPRSELIRESLCAEKDASVR